MDDEDQWLEEAAKKADRWDALWKLKQFKPNADPQGFRVLFSFMSFCTQEEGEAAIDAAIAALEED